MKTFYIFFLTLFSQLVLAQTEFVTRWNLATAGSGDTELNFGVGGTGTVDYTWSEVSPGTASGSGTFLADFAGSIATITGLPDDALIELKINPTNFGWIIINGGTDKDRLIEVSQWGTTAWKTMDYAFKGCSNLQISAPDLPDLSGVTSMYEMFSGCTVLNGPANIGSWETAGVTNMSLVFVGASAFNQPIGTWDTGRVTSMNYMFGDAAAFNQPIGNWNTANVTNMYAMFNGASAFNQPITTQPGGIWNTGNVTNMSWMFRGATAFNTPVGNWDTGKVTDMSGMFANATAFNQPIDILNTGSVTNMNGMFYQAVAFNQPVGNWNTANVTDMFSMFSGASAFNQPITTQPGGIWNTGNVTNMGEMFRDAIAFNQPIANWDTGKVTNTSSMFGNAAAFNQPIDTWNTANVTNMNGMFAIATAFNQPIGNWNTAQVTNMSGMFYQAVAFNQPIGNWNTAQVTDMFSMFNGASAFNQPITTQPGGIWNTGNVTDMSYMFFGATSFNAPIGNWDTGKTTNMSGMFYQAVAFNQPIGNWNTAQVTNLSGMFYIAMAFNQPVGSWNTANVSDLNYMFSNAISFNQSIGTWTLSAAVTLIDILNNTALSCYNYSETLIGWSANPLTPNSLLLGYNDRSYGTNAVAAHSDLITTKGWQINGDQPSGVDCSDPLPVTLISFSGKKTSENQNLLKWITSDEMNFDRFEIQRSSDAKVFERIGAVYGQAAVPSDGTPSDGMHSGQMLNAYTFTDVAPGVANYYRLKMVDQAANGTDGSFQYSRIISIENAMEQAVVGSFYPNPSNGKVFVDVHTLESGSWTLTVTDASGKAIVTQVHGLQMGMNKISLNPLSPGVNLVRFENGMFSEVRKLVRE